MASRLQDVIIRGLAAARPAIATVAPGTLYYSTDTQVVERAADDLSAWQSYSAAVVAAGINQLTGGVTAGPGSGSQVATVVAVPTAALQTPIKTKSITLGIDGGGSAITTGIKADVYVPYTCTITAVTMLADIAGSVVVDIWKDTYANYPPTVADTITAAAKPTISAANKSQNATLTGWNTAITAGDTLRFNVDSVATITKLSLTLTVTL